MLFPTVSKSLFFPNLTFTSSVNMNAILFGKVNQSLLFTMLWRHMNFITTECIFIIVMVHFDEPLLKGRHCDLFIFTFPDPRDTKFVIQIHDNSSMFWYFSISVLYGKKQLENLVLFFSIEFLVPFIRCCEQKFLK